MPKKPEINVDAKRFDGLLNLLNTIQSQMKMNGEEADELKAQVKALIKKFGTDEGTKFTYTNAQGVTALLSIQERETFDVSKAMDILNGLPEKVAKQYQVVSTNKDMIYQALSDGVITPADAKTCVTIKPIEALTVKKADD